MKICKPDGSPAVFRSSDGQYFTQSLFLETSYEDLSNVVYTLKRQDYEHKGVTYLSFPRLYLEIADPTEYEVANVLFDGWPHWQRIQGNGRIMPTIEGLRAELEVKLRSEGVRRMIAGVRAGKPSEKAAMWLADKGWAPKDIGRPSKVKIAAEAKKLQQVQDQVQKDLDRLMSK